MKRLYASCLLLALTLAAAAQDFRLYFSNNVTDVTDFDHIEDATSPLAWREVHDGDFSGNLKEVTDVMAMFASTDMKRRAQQRQFWTMRDHTLLCFRINDGTGTTGSYTVEVEDATGTPLTTTVSKFFFVNAPRQGEDVKIKVAKVGEPANAITFRYRVYDWDDDQLYTFQLDSKRQLNNETYRLQYTTGFTNDEGIYQTDTTTLALRDSTFQTFYVRGRDLLDVFLVSGGQSEQTQEHKLKLNKSRLHTGVTLDPDYSVTSLTPTFRLDKHENRELMNFNWIGSGLYERYDTLYVKLLGSQGQDISRATFHVEAINDKGERIPNNEGLRYIGYDRKLKQHKVLTFGRGAYMEIVASGYVPTLFKYAGAADPVTNIVDEALCSATVQLLTSRGADGSIALSSAHLQALHDTKTVVAYRGTDYGVCDIDDIDFTFRPTADTLFYMDDAGHSWPKVLKNTRAEIEKLARLRMSFAIPRGQSIGSVTLTGTDADSGERYRFDRPQTSLVDISDYPSFNYNYADMTFDMVDVLPPGRTVGLDLSAGELSYREFPYFNHVYIDRGEMRQQVSEDVNDQLPGCDIDDRDAAFADQKISLNLPANFRLNVKPLVFTTSINVDILKQIINVKASASYNQASTDPKRNALREEAKEFNSGSWDNFYKDDKKAIDWNAKGGVGSFDDWALGEMDDIFSYSPATIGAGFFFTGSLAFDLPLKNYTSSVINFKSLGLSAGYGISLATPDLLNNYFGDSGFSRLMSKLPGFNIGLNFEAKAQLDAGIKTYRSFLPSFDASNMGYYAMLSAKAKIGAWAEFSIPPNPIFSFSAGVRGGLKIGAGVGMSGPFLPQVPDFGGYFLVVGGLEAYASVHTFLFNWSGRAGIAWGKHWYWPNTNHNPFRPDYPYWLPTKPASAVADSYHALPKLPASAFGETLVTGVAVDANPHFIDENHIVYNDLQDPADYNDDRVTLLNLDDHAATDLSDSGTSAMRHMRSKRGEHEIVVFEEVGRQIDADEVQPDDATNKNNEISATVRIAAQVKDATTGEWRKSYLTTAGGTVASKPVVTIQDDGKAACIWQSGTLNAVSQDAVDNAIYDNTIRGNLVISFFDGQTWSQPASLFAIDEDHVAAEYDLIMRGDTALIGASILSYPLDSVRRQRQFSFASVPQKTRRATIVPQQMSPLHFFMNRVGQHGIIAMLYEKNDSTRDIYVKTVDMNGLDNGLTGSDLGANFASPNRVKIVCDRSAEKLDDFAILWTEMSNVSHDGDGQATVGDDVRLMLNASRISLQPSAQVTAPITVGAERDSLMMTDFDGFLDDARIRVVYTLGDIETGGAVIMTGEKYFSNSFDYDLSYPREAVLSSNLLPLSLTVRNTGTSSIRQVTAEVNGTPYPIADSYVPPMQQRVFVVNYAMPDDFDGFIRSKVTVDYDNTFRAAHHPRKQNVSFRRQIRQRTVANVSAEDVSCRLVSHTVEDGENIFVVELTDHSVRGFSPRNSIQVGIYSHPSVLTPLYDDGEVQVTSADFVEVNGLRKAYATVKVRHAGKPLKAYLNIHITNQTLNGDIEDTHVPNRQQDNAHHVTLLPHNDPSVVRQIIADKQQPVSFTVKAEEGGLRIGNLAEGSHLRIYTEGGLMVANKNDVKGNVFVPLQWHGIYIVSNGKEAVKIQR